MIDETDDFLDMVEYELLTESFLPIREYEGLDSLGDRRGEEVATGVIGDGDDVSSGPRVGGDILNSVKRSLSHATR